MAVFLSPVGGAASQFFNNDGTVLSGGKLYTYAAGTSTLVASYTTSAGSVAHTNPIILNSAGRVSSGEIWLTGGASYKFLLKDSNDVLIATYDNVYGISDVTLPIDSSNITYDPPFVGSVATNVEAKLSQYISVKDFGAVGNGTTDDTAAIQSAITQAVASGYALYFGDYSCKYKLTDRLTITDPINIFGHGAQIWQSVANKDIFYIDSGFNSFCYSIGGLFLGTAAGTGNCIQMLDAGNSYFYDLKSPGCGNAFILDRSGLLNTFIRCYVGSGVTATPGFFGACGTQAYGFQFLDTGNSGNGPNANTLIGCYASNSTTWGYYIEGGANTIVGCDAEGGIGGCFLTGRSQSVFGGAFENNTQDIKYENGTGGGYFGVSSLGVSGFINCKGSKISGSFYVIGIDSDCRNILIDGVYIDTGGSVADSGINTKWINVVQQDGTDISRFNQKYTFTPTLSFGGASTNLTYYSNTGTAYRYNNTIYFDLMIYINQKGSSTGTALISGLPIASVVSSFAGFPVTIETSLVNTGITAEQSRVAALITSLATTIDIYADVNSLTTQRTALTDANFVNDSQIRISGTYRI